MYFFALCTALFWGIIPIFNKRGLALGGTPLQCSLTVVGVNLLLFWMVLLVGMERPWFSELSWRTFVIFALGGLFGTALGRLMNAAGIDQVGATVNSAVTSTRPLFAATLGVLWLGEPGEFLLFVGIGLLIGGIVLLIFSRGGDIRGWHTRDLWIPVTAAVVLAIGNVLRRLGLSTTTVSITEALVINQSTAFALLAVYAVGRRRWDVIRAPARTYLFFAVSGVMGALALVALFQALSRGPVGVVDSLIGTKPLFTTLLAYALIGDLERITVRLILGTGLVVLGATLVVLYDRSGPLW